LGVYKPFSKALTTLTSGALQERTALGKKVSALKGEDRYIDACRVVNLGIQNRKYGGSMGISCNFIGISWEYVQGMSQIKRKSAGPRFLQLFVLGWFGRCEQVGRNPPRNLMPSESDTSKEGTHASSW